MQFSNFRSFAIDGNNFSALKTYEQDDEKPYVNLDLRMSILNYANNLFNPSSISLENIDRKNAFYFFLILAVCNSVMVRAFIT